MVLLGTTRGEVVAVFGGWFFGLAVAAGYRDSFTPPTVMERFLSIG